MSLRIGSLSPCTAVYADVYDDDDYRMMVMMIKLMVVMKMIMMTRMHNMTENRKPFPLIMRMITG